MSYEEGQEGRADDCPSCFGTGWRNGTEPPRTGDELHPYGRCACYGEMSPDCAYCRGTCPQCLGSGKR